MTTRATSVAERLKALEEMGEWDKELERWTIPAAARCLDEVASIRAEIEAVAESIRLQNSALSLGHYCKKNVGEPLEGFEASLWDYMKLAEDWAERLTPKNIWMTRETRPQIEAEDK